MATDPEPQRATGDQPGDVEQPDDATQTSAKPEPAKDAPPAASKAEPSNAEPSNAEPSNAEPSNAEPSTAEPSNAEPSNAEPSTAEPSNAEPSTAEPSKDPAAKAEPAGATPTKATPAKATGGARRASTKTDADASAAATPRRAGRESLDLLRSRIAKLVGLLCVLAALILALGVVLIALRKNVTETNSVVKAVFDLADVVDGPFSREHGVFSFASETKNALANWGLAAVVYLILGRVLSAIIGPRH